MWCVGVGVLARVGIHGISVCVCVCVGVGVLAHVGMRDISVCV